MMAQTVESKRFNFIKSKIDSLEADNGTEPSFYDLKQPGLMIRIRKSGRKSFEVRKKIKGKAVRIVLGVYPDMTIEQARNAARSAINKASEGKNPSKQVDAKRAVEISLAESLKEYLFSRQGGTKPLRQNSIDAYQRAVNIHLKMWKGRAIASISRDDVEKRHRAISKHSESAADYSMRVLRAVHNYISEKYRDEDGRVILFDNPVSQINQNKSWGELKTRSNIIYDHHLSDWFEAVESMPSWLLGSNISPEVTRDYFLFVLFTGLRRREASNVEHRWIDMDAKTIVVPSDDTKNHQAHRLPLSPFLMEIVERRINNSDHFLFENPNTGKAITEPKRIVNQIRERCGMYFTIHDLRRTFATIASRIIARDYVIKRILNHKPLKHDVTAQSYINLTVDDLREPMNAISEHILTVARRHGSNVIPIAASRK